MIIRIHGNSVPQVLIHLLDAVTPRPQGVMKVYTRSSEPYLPRVRLVHTGQDLHQRRLPSPVVPDQTHDFVGVYGEIDAVQRRHGAEGLRNLPHLLQGRHDHASGNTATFTASPRRKRSIPWWMSRNGTRWVTSRPNSSRPASRRRTAWGNAPRALQL